MYLGPTFAPLSLVGLLFRGSSVAASVPSTMVSVVIPVHNGEKDIEACIRSLEEQSLRRSIDRKIGLSVQKILSAIPYYYLLRISTAVVFWKSFILPKRTGW